MKGQEVRDLIVGQSYKFTLRIGVGVTGQVVAFEPYCSCLGRTRCYGCWSWAVIIDSGGERRRLRDDQIYAAKKVVNCG